MGEGVSGGIGSEWWSEMMSGRKSLLYEEMLADGVKSLSVKILTGEIGKIGSLT